MKSLIIVSTYLALITTTAHAGWFGPCEEVISLHNQLVQEHSATGFWGIVVGCLALFAIITFIIGAMLGSVSPQSQPGEPVV